MTAHMIHTHTHTHTHTHNQKKKMDDDDDDDDWLEQQCSISELVDEVANCRQKLVGCQGSFLVTPL